MKWLTQKQVIEAAKKSRKAAIECSRLHWEQLATATEASIKTKAQQLCDETDLVGSTYCSLCVRARGKDRSLDCRTCPMSNDQICWKNGSQWKKCYRTFGTSGFPIEAKKMEQILGELS